MGSKETKLESHSLRATKVSIIKWSASSAQVKVIFFLHHCLHFLILMPEYSRYKYDVGKNRLRAGASMVAHAHSQPSREAPASSQLNYFIGFLQPAVNSSSDWLAWRTYSLATRTEIANALFLETLRFDPSFARNYAQDIVILRNGGTAAARRGWSDARTGQESQLLSTEFLLI